MILFTASGLCSHKEILILHLKSTNLRGEKLKKRPRSESPVNENDSNVANVQHPEIKMKKKKKESNLTPELLEKVQIIEETLDIRNLMKSFKKGKTFAEFQEHCTKVMESKKDLLHLANELTIEQADTDLWHNLRVGRVTASRLYETSRCTMKNGSLVEKVLGKRSGFSFAMFRGTVLEDYVFNEIKKEYKDLKRCGLIMNHEKHPLFAASPDGLHDDFVLEIKCPANKNTFAQYTNIDKLDKKYFAQIQMQMYITGKKKALLSVAALDFETTRNVTKIWIPFDEEKTNQLITDAAEFYESAIFPALKRTFLS
jgi:putative phage-type endonuclease